MQTTRRDTLFRAQQLWVRPPAGITKSYRRLPPLLRPRQRQPRPRYQNPCPRTTKTTSVPVLRPSRLRRHLTNRRRWKRRRQRLAPTVLTRLQPRPLRPHPRLRRRPRHRHSLRRLHRRDHDGGSDRTEFAASSIIRPHPRRRHRRNSLRHLQPIGVQSRPHPRATRTTRTPLLRCPKYRRRVRRRPRE